MTDRKAFLASVRQALGRRPGDVATPQPIAGLSVPDDELERMARQVREVMAERAGGLLDEMAEAASRAGWVVHRAVNDSEAVEVIRDICVDSGARSVLKSVEEPLLASERLDDALAAAGMDVRAMVRPEGTGAEVEKAMGELRSRVFEADVGITGADYGIAETGTVVLHPRMGLSRLISLAPPLHVAVLRKGDVLPSLDELFLLERESHVQGRLAGSMNLITGPSRTGDIEGAIVTGIHGPTEVHLALVDRSG